MTLPDCQTLLLHLQHGVLHVTLNRPDSRNAMSLQMVEELLQLLEAIHDREDLRVVVLRGSGGHFCAGGDVRDMAQARQQASAGQEDAYEQLNRRFGTLIQRANRQPQTLVAVLEGAVLGGGFGLACVSDVALATADARFGLPETSLGLLPAQIAPFVVQRIGLTQARRLALTGVRIDAHEALRLGLIHRVSTAPDTDLEQELERIRQCAPLASRATKALLFDSLEQPLEAVLDQAARSFGQAVTHGEGIEGTLAFMQKRPPRWAAPSE